MTSLILFLFLMINSTGSLPDFKEEWSNKNVLSADSACNKTEFIWQFDHYEATPGSIVGIHAEDDSYTFNAQKLKAFKDTLGFNYICTVETLLNTVIAAGFDRNHVMIGGFTTDGPWKQTILNTMPVWAYYADEQGQDYSYDVVQNWFKNMRQFLDESGNSNIKIVGGETNEDDFESYNLYAETMCTKYCLDFSFICWFYDQRGLWSDFRSKWNSKFNMTWISAYSDWDNDEFDDLIGHARKLGLQGIWFFQMDDFDVSEKLEKAKFNSFCFYAWKWGYLQKIEKQYAYKYRCVNNDPCDCNSNASGWILVGKSSTDNYRTVKW
jgi:hypothetical protein